MERIKALEIVLAVIVIGAGAFFLFKKLSTSKSRGYWDSSMIENKHPGSDWVYLPSVAQDNDFPLMFEPDRQRKKAAQNLLKRIISKDDYSIELERDFSADGKLEGIRVIDTTRGQHVCVGEVDRDAFLAIKERYDQEMPLSVFAKSVFKFPDGSLHLTMGVLIPKKSLRKKYELG